MSTKNLLVYSFNRLGVTQIDIYRPASLDPQGHVKMLDSER